jgi:hypothetical protein
MIPRLILAPLLLLSVTGCVAIPLVAQMAGGGNSVGQLCSMVKIPGQTTSLCERFAPASPAQAPAAAPQAKALTTAER